MKRVLVACSAAAALLAISSVGYALKAKGEPQLGIQNEERSSSRALFYTQDADSFAINGQFNVDYAPPMWKADYQKQMDSIPAGKRLRLGKNSWARLENDVDCTIGGAAVGNGLHYLCAAKTKDGWALIALDAAAIRKAHLDAFQSSETTGGVEIPMTYSKSETEADELTIRFVKDEQGATANLEVMFGPHKLTAPLVPKF